MENAKKCHVVGIDIGGTNTVFGIVNAAGEILAKGTIKTQTHDEFEVYLDELSTALRKLIDQEVGMDAICGIGIGAPNGCYADGTISYAPNLPWRGVLPLARRMEEIFGLPTVLTNDANAAAIGEMTYGAVRGMNDFIMITLGTGVGSGIVANGSLIYGHDSFAGELGHYVVRRNNGRACGCGRKGCLEAYASATGVARTAREFLESRDQSSSLRALPIETITSKDVFDAAVGGDVLAQEIFEFTGNILGEACADFASFSSPEAFVFFGGLTRAGNILMNPIRQSMERNLLFNYRGKIRLLFSELPESDAAVLGASAMGWEAKERA